MDAFDLKKSGELPEIEINFQTLKFAFQPIFDIKSGDVFGYEALMRPGKYPPAEVIESYAKVDMLDYIEGITFQFATKAFLDAKLEGFLFLNTFPGTCMPMDWANRVFSSYGKQLTNRLYIEILEYTSLNPFAWNVKRRAMESLGLKPHYAIDDFGTGENFDIDCVRQYKPELVKIDRQFISHIDTDIRNQEIVDEIIHYMRKNNIKILAEGVETKAEFLYLMRKDIDFMQGFYLGKPTIYK